MLTHIDSVIYTDQNCTEFDKKLKMFIVAAASVFCAPGVALRKDPGHASLSKQHKGDDFTRLLCLAFYCL